MPILHRLCRAHFLLRFSVAEGSALTSSLTPAEIAEGWIRLFDGKAIFGWTPQGKVKWSVEDRTLQSAPGSEGSLHTTTQFTDCEMRVECRAEGSTFGTLFAHCPPDVPITSQNAYTIRLGNTDLR
ncbi:MAG TPA: family 16 glycoside hydrolase [Chthonomonadales bacterium]|nr:family 16 glycoside hydrolase [Chthonomonadales bacterium]